MEECVLVLGITGSFYILTWVAGSFLRVDRYLGLTLGVVFLIAAFHLPLQIGWFPSTYVEEEGVQ